jgi:hypothetical protein
VATGSARGPIVDQAGPYEQEVCQIGWRTRRAVRCLRANRAVGRRSGMTFGTRDNPPRTSPSGYGHRGIGHRLHIAQRRATQARWWVRPLARVILPPMP